MTSPAESQACLFIPEDIVEFTGLSDGKLTGVKGSFSVSVSKKDTEPESVPEVIERVYDNASDAWKAAASQIIRRLCETRNSFDLDDVAEAIKPIDHLPHKPRAVGHLMKKARKDGWCRIIGYKKSQRDSRHHGVISEDESLIFGI